MDDLFSPTLIVSLGPSSGKALELSRKLMCHLPDHLLKVIGFYNIEDINSLGKDLQLIIDEDLLSARNLNRLVDMGFKVRNDIVNQVRINVYLLWDLYSSRVSGYEVIKILAGLNYGNVNKDLHSGASIFILPILKKEWEFEMDIRVRAIEELRECIDYISHQDRLLAIDSKVYLLHYVSNDGTRISVEELEQIASLLIYTNIVPSKDPPLSHYNKRLLLTERKYKIGAVGITSLTSFTDELLQCFAVYLAGDILNHSINYESEIDLSSFGASDLVDCETLREKLREIACLEQNDISKVLDEEQTMDSLGGISSYQEVFRVWKKCTEDNCLASMGKIDSAIAAINEEIRITIDSEAEAIAKKHSLKTAASYLGRLEKKAREIKAGGYSNPADNLTELDKRLGSFLNRFPDVAWIACGALALAAILVICLAVFVFPHTSTTFDIASSIILIMILSAVPYIGSLYKNKKTNYYAALYRKGLLEKKAVLLNNYIEEAIVENNEVILTNIKKKRNEIEDCIKISLKLRERVSSEIPRDEEPGSLVTSILNLVDRKKFYQVNKPCISSTHENLMREIKYCSRLKEESIYEVVLDFSRQVSQKYTCMNLQECLRFKYGEGLEEEIVKWVDRGRIKSKYLLQYINSERLEEHTIFITTPEVYSMIKNTISNRFDNISIAEGENKYANSLSIIRLCFGIDLESIPSVKSTGM